MDREVLRRLLRFSRPHWWALPSVVVLGLLASLAEGIGIGLLVPLLDLLINGGPSEPSGPFARFMQQASRWLGDEPGVVGIALAMIALIVVKSAILVANVALAVWLSGRITHDLRTSLHGELLQRDYGDVASRDQGELLNVLDAQTYRTSEAMNVLAALVGAGCTIVVFTVLLLLTSWTLMLTVAFGVALVSLIMRRLSTQARRYGEELVSAYSLLAGRLVESLTHLRLIRLFGQELREAARFRAASEAVRQRAFQTELLTGIILPLGELLYLPLFFLVLVVAWQAEVAFASLAAFLVLLYRMQSPLKSFDHCRVTLGTYSGGVRAVAGLVEQTLAPAAPTRGRPFTGFQKEIAFDGVTFAYAPDRDGPPAVRDVSFGIGRGEVVALVGGSGAGKSTLVNLLCRLYDPQEGEILIDGVPLAELDVASWRSRIGFAGQDAELMSDTVAENIAYGRPGADMTAIERAARLAHADQFIAALPAGYHTRVGPRGLSLSGGQRQRIALARALAREPDLLILDEATNALDGLSEQAIQEAIENVRGQLTIILIAHRLSTVRLADRVVAMMEGRVVEQGRPQELLRRDGLYARLHSLQVADA